MKKVSHKTGLFHFMSHKQLETQMKHGRILLALVMTDLSIKFKYPNQTLPSKRSFPYFGHLLLKKDELHCSGSEYCHWGDDYGKSFIFIFTLTKLPVVLHPSQTSVFNRRVDCEATLLFFPTAARDGVLARVFSFLPSQLLSKYISAYPQLAQWDFPNKAVTAYFSAVRLTSPPSLLCGISPTRLTLLPSLQCVLWSSCWTTWSSELQSKPQLTLLSFIYLLHSSTHFFSQYGREFNGYLPSEPPLLLHLLLHLLLCPFSSLF